MISFCTWIYNRLHQYRRVIETNLERSDDFDAEFVLLDFGSTDGLVEYVQSLAEPRIKLVRREFSQEGFHFAKLYNAAIRESSWSIVVTLDADNLIGIDYCQWCLNKVDDGRWLWAWDGNYRSGTCGRIACTRADFERLGGYDENLGQIGYQDLDLIARAKAMGMHVHETRRVGVVGGAIMNDREDTCRALGWESYRQCNTANANRSKTNILMGKLVANQ